MLLQLGIRCKSLGTGQGGSVFDAQPLGRHVGGGRRHRCGASGPNTIRLEAGAAHCSGERTGTCVLYPVGYSNSIPFVCVCAIGRTHQDPFTLGHSRTGGRRTVDSAARRCGRLQLGTQGEPVAHVFISNIL